jgi:hypothetical protein
MAEDALLTPGDAGWTEALIRVRHDVYHLPQYVEIDAQLTGGTPAAFRYDEAGQVLLLPLVLRTVPGTGHRDAMSPYGYPGPVSNSADAGFWSRACRALVSTLRMQGIITAFVRLHPLLPVPIAVLAEAGQLVRHGETVSVDLTLSIDDMWKQTRRDHRNQINRARRAGTEVVFDDWGPFDEWVGMYHANMRRVQATDFYFFDREHFERLHIALKDDVHLAVALDGDELVAGNLFFEHGGIMNTHLQATRDGKNQWAGKLLYDEVRRWGHERGHTIYHLGGGLGGAADSLFDFKAGFADGRHPFHTWRIVADRAAFEQLAGKPTPELLAGRFPPYR